VVRARAVAHLALDLGVDVLTVGGQDLVVAVPADRLALMAWRLRCNLREILGPESAGAVEACWRQQPAQDQGQGQPHGQQGDNAQDVRVSAHSEPVFPEEGPAHKQ
jgi:hypothetical protein